MKKEIYKYTLVGGELVTRKGIGEISDTCGRLVNFVYEDAKGRGKSHCNRYMCIPIDEDGYYKSSVYLDEDDTEKAIRVLLKHQEEMSFNYHKAFTESERKVRYLKELLAIAQYEKANP